MSIGLSLQSIPAAAWGVIGVFGGAALGVVGTLGATFLSNRSNNERFDKQLEHDALQKSRDRAVTLKSPVYLNAGEQLIAVNAFLGGLTRKSGIMRRA